MTRQAPAILGCLVCCLQFTSASGAAVPISASPEAKSSIYEIRDGRVRFLDPAVELSANAATSVTLKVRGRPAGSFLTATEKNSVESEPFVPAADSDIINIVARGISVQDVWPRIRVTLVPQGARSGSVLFEGYVASRTFARVPAIAPSALPATSVVLQVELLNPASDALPEPRTVVIKSLEFGISGKKKPASAQ